MDGTRCPCPRRYAPDLAAARAHAERTALRLREQSQCWAALSTGDTRQILDAVRLLRPSALQAIRDFVANVKPGKDAEEVHVRLHDMLDAEADAFTSDPQQFGRVRDALEKLQLAPHGLANDHPWVLKLRDALQ